MTLVTTLLIVGFYPYVGYPILIWLIGKIVRKELVKKDEQWRVTVVIAAFNEKEHIGATVTNKLEQDYPTNLLNVVVVSDGSSDDTDELVGRLVAQSDRVELIRQERAGKTAGLNLALDKIDSDIVVFADANSIYAKDAITRLIAAFADSTVGYVSGRMQYGISRDSIASEGSSSYMRYENLLRSLESRVGSVVGVDGGIDAIRRELYQPMRDNELPDFALPLRVIEQGYRVVYESDAVLYEDALRSTKDEFRMRVRVSARAIWTLLDFKHLANPFKYGLFSFQLVSHKWLRYLSFIPFAAAYATALLTFAGGTTSKVVAIAMSALAIAGILGIWRPSLLNRLTVVRWSAYFGLLNIASAIALMKVLSGKRVTTWQPRVG